MLERWREGERAGEKHQCVVGYHAPPTGNLAAVQSRYAPWLELSLRPFGWQASAQSTEPHQPGQIIEYFEGSVASDPLKSNLIMKVIILAF